MVSTFLKKKKLTHKFIFYKRFIILILYIFKKKKSNAGSDCLYHAEDYVRKITTTYSMYIYFMGSEEDRIHAISTTTLEVK